MMKKLFTLILLLTVLSPVARAEAIKLKNGMIINGSITGQTEYILNVKTSYGTITINQREVDKIMQDLHRVILKGGGEFVGTVMDLDQFNLTLKTDNGIVNIDVAQIASMEIYDYNEAEKQKEYVEKKVELEKQAVSALPTSAAADTMEQKTAAAEAGSTISGGLAFDSDLETVFPSKPEVVQPTYVYNYRVHTEEDKDKAAEQETVLPGETTKEAEEIDTENQIKKKDIAKNYFGINAGILSTPLTLDMSEYNGKSDADVGGSGVSFGLTYMRRLNKHWWLGGNFGIGMLSKNYFEGLTVDSQTDVAMKTSGQIYDIALISNFYINPESKTRLYLTGGVGYTSLSIDGNTSYYTDPLDPNTLNNGDPVSFSTSAASGLFGIGIERTIKDINIGVELRGKYTSYSGDLAESSKVSVLAGLKVNWYF